MAATTNRVALRGKTAGSRFMIAGFEFLQNFLKTFLEGNQYAEQGVHAHKLHNDNGEMFDKA
jgi:hypothetical protein